MFTDERVHVMDELVANCLVCIPMFMVDAPMAVYFALLLMVSKTVPCQFKANFDLLRYVLVTLQSHRLHHSIEPQHRNRNFGDVRTLHPACETYPATGITDSKFPLDREATGTRVISNYGLRCSILYTDLPAMDRYERSDIAHLLERGFSCARRWAIEFVSFCRSSLKAVEHRIAGQGGKSSRSRLQDEHLQVQGPAAGSVGLGLDFRRWSSYPTARSKGR